MDPPVNTTSLNAVVARLGRTVITGALTLLGAISSAGNFAVTGTLGVAGVTTLASDTNVGGDLTVSGNAATTGNASVGGTFDVTGVATLANNAAVGGDLGVANKLTVTGNTSVGEFVDQRPFCDETIIPSTLQAHLVSLGYVERRADVTRVHFSSATVPDTSAYAVPFDTVQWDPNGNWDPVLFRYTVPRTGFYDIRVTLRSALPSGYIRCWLQGGTDFVYGTEVGPVAGGNTTTHLSTIYGLGSGDVFQVFAFQTSGVPLALQVGANFSYLTVQYVGQIGPIL